MKLFFFGGTFDPPHNGHLAIIDYCMKLCDKLIVLPSKISPLKNKYPIASDLDRMKMLTQATANHKNVDIDDYEIKQEGKSFTINTINYLNQKFPNYDISMVIGLDQLQDFDNWMSNDEILSKVNIVCFKRDGYFTKKKYLNTKVIMDFDCNISSSYIRKNFFKKDFNYSSYLDKKVYLYIKDNKLYT